jgi:hypothetical protein
MKPESKGTGSVQLLFRNSLGVSEENKNILVIYYTDRDSNQAPCECTSLARVHCIKGVEKCRS